jgi:peptide chain release factor 2
MAMSRPDFWADQARARRQSERAAALRSELAAWDSLAGEVEHIRELTVVALESDDRSLEPSLRDTLRSLAERFQSLEFTTLLSGPYDERSAVLAIHAGSGGTEAQDWAAMLLRMYLRFAEGQGWRTRLLDEHRGEVAGVKSVTVAVEGRFAYGYLKSEQGVHRLVRISPFDAEKMRHTSFALVEVLPELEAIEEIAIDPKDLRVDTFLSSGHGGQSVQTTYSAVRVVHLPTGITVSCQNERSQQQNRETALKILQSKLHQLKLKEQQAEKQKLRGAYQSAEWGNQARSYVLQPYQLVKDHRTKFEAVDATAVLDGKLRPFMEGYLRWSLEQERKIK